MLDDIIGVTEAAELLKLSPGTVKNKCAAGELPAKKIGKTWVLSKSKLLEGLEMSFDQLNVRNSTIIEWKGMELRTTQDPYIDDTHYGDWRDEEFRFKAHAVDANDNEYQIIWNVKDGFDMAQESDDMSEACDWDNPTSVELIRRNEFHHELMDNEEHNFVIVGTWWNDPEGDIALLKVNGDVYALDGWTGESYASCWKCTGENYQEVDGEDTYTLTPINEPIEWDENGDPIDFKEVRWEVTKN